MFQGNRCVLDLMAFPVSTVGHCARVCFQEKNSCQHRWPQWRLSGETGDKWSYMNWIQIITSDKMLEFSRKTPIYRIKGDFIPVRIVCHRTSILYLQGAGFHHVLLPYVFNIPECTNQILAPEGEPHVFTLKAIQLVAIRNLTARFTHWTFPQTAQITCWKYRRPLECELKPG